ncbi:glycoside hydrolase family 16 protein [Phycicoccus sonneratiae]|uniref:Glycoside hydrolase family 16 protein n=1 Tax=Phycicoccus sonneratiae TaxID=2807628 RepID=A0ABS2CNY8_9MICO|nr:glycoside hydrolase family 16 protein [Phycicoccus sonneraticus]MBM6400779.1 glycoside hydrolase family 16 protein [Phycicoccus sonneraticus]
MSFRDDFPGPDLDRSVWLPHYLPAWSTRGATAASYRIGRDGLVLDVPVDHPVWMPGEHDPPLRVSGIQSGSWSGPAGSTLGQQRFRDGLVVRSEEPRFEGWLPSSGRVEIRCRMALSPRSMAALWLSGFEDDPAQERCGELCVVEIFGGSVRDGSCEVGVGIKAFRDPALTQDFDAPRLPVDPADPHTYAVDWDADEAVFTVDGQVVRRCPNPPTYPMQLMVAVFDFPRWSVGGDDDLVPELVVEHVAG